jgi:RNA polymerase sigma-70 factor, ECF subfamily
MTLRPLERFRVARWAHRFRSELLRQARSVCGSAHEAEDAVQEVMLKAVQKHGTLKERPDAVVQAYLRAILLNHLRSAWRQKGRIPLAVVTDDFDVPAPAPEDPPPFTDQQVSEAMEGLPGRMRQALDLRLEGRSYKQIAKVMDVKVGTVGAWLAEARVRLRDELVDPEEYGGRGDSGVQEDSQ